MRLGDDFDKMPFVRKLVLSAAILVNKEGTRLSRESDEYLDSLSHCKGELRLPSSQTYHGGSRTELRFGKTPLTPADLVCFEYDAEP